MGAYVSVSNANKLLKNHLNLEPSRNSSSSEEIFRSRSFCWTHTPTTSKRPKRRPENTMNKDDKSNERKGDDKPMDEVAKGGEAEPESASSSKPVPSTAPSEQCEVATGPTKKKAKIPAALKQYRPKKPKDMPKRPLSA